MDLPGEELMCLPALAAKSDATMGPRKRIYETETGESLLTNKVYAEQFHSAAGSHTGAQSASSVRVYSNTDRQRLYDGLAGRPGLQGPPAPFNTPRRRFPGASVSRVDGLLRGDASPLASEHPSEYGELYTGAAGAPKHWLLGTVEQISPGRHRVRALGAGPSQVDEVVLGHDIDGSTELTWALHGRAGIKSMGMVPRMEGRRNIPGGGESSVDELIWGSDVDNSSDPHVLQGKAQLFQGAAGSAGVCGSARRHTGRRNIPGGGESSVDELIWGSDVDNSSDPHVLQAKAQLFQGAAGGTAGALPRSEVGRRHVQHTESVETVSRGRKKLPSGRDRVGQLLTGEASQLGAEQTGNGISNAPQNAPQNAPLCLYVSVVFSTDQQVFNVISESLRFRDVQGKTTGEARHETRLPSDFLLFLRPAHIAQRSHVGAASQVDDVVLHRDIDGSNLQFQEFAELMAGAAGRRCVGAQDRVEGKRHKEAVTSLVQEVFSPESPPLQAQRPARRRIPVAAASLVDDVVLDRDIDGSRQRFLDYAELTAGAAGRPCVGTQERQDGRVPRKHLPVGAASGFAVPSADDAVSSFVALTAGAAGRRYAGAAARAEGRRCFQKASMMKEIFSEAL
ncbi:unnamed protein product [Durusdinium trenchii]|uniref:Uncharacterized protein n=2 Tax=Durusdinium trenchii TaxID=1381693 RepID=A0ABP0I268_9DINO